ASPRCPAIKEHLLSAVFGERMAFSVEIGELEVGRDHRTARAPGAGTRDRRAERPDAARRVARQRVAEMLGESREVEAPPALVEPGGAPVGGDGHAQLALA